MSEVHYEVVSGVDDVLAVATAVCRCEDQLSDFIQMISVDDHLELLVRSHDAYTVFTVNGRVDETSLGKCVHC